MIFFSAWIFFGVDFFSGWIFLFFGADFQVNFDVDFHVDFLGIFLKSERIFREFFYVGFFIKSSTEKNPQRRTEKNSPKIRRVPGGIFKKIH